MHLAFSQSVSFLVLNMKVYFNINFSYFRMCPIKFWLFQWRALNRISRQAHDFVQHIWAQVTLVKCKLPFYEMNVIQHWLNNKCYRALVWLVKFKGFFDKDFIVCLSNLYNLLYHVFSSKKVTTEILNLHRY